MLHVPKNFKLCAIVILKNPVSFFKKKKKVSLLCSVLYKGVAFLCKKAPLYDGLQLRDAPLCDVLFCERMLYCTVALVNLALLFDRTTSTPCSLSTTTGTCSSACTRSFASACTRSTPTPSKSPQRRRSAARTGRSRPPSLYASKLQVRPSQC